MTLNVSRFPRAIPKIKLGDRIRIIRRDMDLTQEEFVAGLSEYLPNVKAKAFGAWEAGRNEPPNKDEVCVALERYTGAPKEWFMGWLDASPTGPGSVTERYRTSHKSQNWDGNVFDATDRFGATAVDQAPDQVQEQPAAAA